MKLTSNVKYILIAVAVILLAWIAVGVAKADVPLGASHTCAYSDPAQSGQGLELHVIPATDTSPARAVGSLFVGAIPQYYRYAPSWFSVQGTFAEGDGLSQTLPVYQTVNVVLGQSNPPELVQMGQIRLTATTPDTLVAELRLDAQSGFSPPDPVISVTFNLRCLVR